MRQHSRTRRRSVCIVRHAYYPDGHVRRDAETLTRAGFNVHVIALRQAGQARREQLHGVTVHRLPVEHRRGSVFRYVWEYLAFAFLAFCTVGLLHWRHRFAVVEVDNMPDGLVFSALIPKLTGVPVILYIFDNMPELMTTIRGVSPRHPLVRLLAMLERLSAAFADQVVVTQEIARRIVVERGTPAGKVHVVLNCPDEQLFPFDASRERCLSNDTFEIVTHGAVLERYGIQVLIDTVSDLSRVIPNLKVHVFGSGEYLPALEERVRDRNVASIVTFHGFVPFEDLLVHLRRAHVGYVGMLCDVMLSNKLMEFASLNVPAVVARWPTYEHYFPDDTVTYYRPGDAQDLKRAIQEVYSDPEKAAVMAQRAAERYADYRWSVQQHAYLGVYRSLGLPALSVTPTVADYAPETVG